MIRAVRWRDDEGSILVPVILVSLVIGALASLALASGRQADWSSASDRNSEVALAVAEGGLHDVIASINVQAGQSTTGTCKVYALRVNESSKTKWPGNHCFEATTPQGTYDVDVQRTSKGFILDSQATTGGQVLGRARHVKLTLVPTELYEPNGRYALFSWGFIDLKNNDAIQGDIWANNGGIDMDKDTVNGSITSALSYIDFKNANGSTPCTGGGSKTVCGFMWSGGFKSSTQRAIDMAGATVGGWVKASVPTPNCASPENAANYTVNGGDVAGSVTSFGSISGGTYGAGTLPNTCTASPTPKTKGTQTSCADATGPCFTFNRNNYDPTTIHDYSTAAAFNAIDKSSLSGVFVINEPSPSQSSGHFVDLGGATVTGDTVIVTNAPVDTDDIHESGSNLKTFVVVSHYRPASASCSDQGGDCAIHAKNHFNVLGDGTCTTAALLYADNGPIAMKNNAKMCGTAIGQNIFLKNNLELAWDENLYRVIGFGPQALEVARWEELKKR